MGTPDLSIILVSYNSRDLLAATLASVRDTVVLHEYEVLIADNASRDGSVEMLRRDWPGVSVIETGSNVGFARAAALAASAASSRNLLFLNSDTMALAGAIDTLVDFLDAHPDVGAVAPRLLNSDLTDQRTARRFPTPMAALFGRRSLLTRLFPRNRWSRGYLFGAEQTGDRAFAVDWVSGACMMLRRSVLEDVGGLDEKFFMYWEDADLCRRISAAGYSVYCEPRAEVIHHQGGSSKGPQARQIWIFHRSAYRYYVKHHAAQRWNPLRPAAAVALFGRALLVMAGSSISTTLRLSADRRLAAPRSR